MADKDTLFGARGAGRKEGVNVGMPYRRLLEAVRFFLLFITCMLLCYGAILLMSDRFLPANPYRQPHGNAVKVVKVIREEPTDEPRWYQDRLQVFFWLGE